MSKKKKKDKPIRIMTLDTETRGLDGAIFRAGMYDGKHYWDSDDIRDLIQIIRNQSERYMCHVYIHNADFDLSKFFQYIVDDVDFTKSIFINNVAVMIPLNDNITFHCSYRLLPSSLEKLSKDFGLEDDGKMDLEDVIKEQGYKDKTDYFMRVPADDPILNEYMEKDCTSLHKILMIILEVSGLYKRDFVKCPTVASLAMKVFKEGYPDDYELAISSSFHGELGKMAEEISRNAYYGGRTEVFYPRLDDGFHYDVNSLYPYVMKVNSFPYGWYDYYTEAEAWNKWKKWLSNRNGGGIIHCTVKVPKDMFVPPLPYRRNGKLAFPVGTLEGYWIYEEIEMAIRYGCIVEQVYSVLHFQKREMLFQGYVSEMEVMKTTSKGAKKQFAKLMQNSLYGKFGMSRERDAFVNIKEEEKLIAEGKPYHIIENKFYQTDFIETVKMSQAQYIQPHIAAYVTGFARILLYESIMEATKKGNKIAYCDTDSMVLDCELPSELVDDNEYGKWKLEYKVKEGIFFQPKFYYEDVIKSDGTSKEIMKAKGIPGSRMKDLMTKEKYEDIIQKLLDGDERYVLYDEKIEVPVTNKKKLGSSLKQSADPNILLICKKSLNLRSEQKRIMDYKHNMSRPHTVDDSMEDMEESEIISWMNEQDKLMEFERALDLMIKEYDKIGIPKKGSMFRKDYDTLTKASQRKYFKRDGLQIDVWLQEINDEFDAWTDPYTEDDIFTMIRKVEFEE